MYRDGTKLRHRLTAGGRGLKAFLGHAQKVGPDALVEAGIGQLPTKLGMSHQALGHLRLRHVSLPDTKSCPLDTFVPRRENAALIPIKQIPGVNSAPKRGFWRKDQAAVII